MRCSAYLFTNHGGLFKCPNFFGPSYNQKCLLELLTGLLEGEDQGSPLDPVTMGLRDRRWRFSSHGELFPVSAMCGEVFVRVNILAPVLDRLPV